MNRITGMVISAVNHNLAHDYVSVRCSHRGELRLLEAFAPVKLFQIGEIVTVEFRNSDHDEPAFYKREL